MDDESSNPKSEFRNPNSLWLLVGLGNPGLEYAATFHNVGFRVLKRLAGELRVPISERFEGARISEKVSLCGQDAVLVLPQTYMNRSGVVLRPLFERFNTTIQHTLVVYDDVALPLGKLRIRQKGSAGGHNGLKSIISATGSDEFLRVRVGIRPDRDIGDVREFVLSAGLKADQELLEKTEEAAFLAVKTVLADGIEKAMAAYNGIDLREPTQGHEEE